ncbi:UNVERIFIED_ORG: hypothetical protein QQG_5595, partial [Clostridioides difficile Y384]
MSLQEFILDQAPKNNIHTSISRIQILNFFLIFKITPSYCL